MYQYVFIYVLILNLFSVSVFAQGSSVSGSSVILRDQFSGRIRGFQSIEGTDFYLGGLMRIHTDIRGVKCSETFSENGVEETEAFLSAIDSVNANPNILPGITLGYDVRDYCGADSVAIDEVTEWALTSSVATEGDFSASESMLAAVVGAFHSRVSAPVATFLRPFEVPQVSYGSTSPTLSDRNRYTYFLRTVPPDTMQSRVVVDLMLTLDWTVVSAIHSNEVYGISGIDQFRSLASEAELCLDIDLAINEDFGPDDYAELAQILYTSQANVILLFSLEVYVAPLLRAVNAITPVRRFVWIATDTWAESRVIQEEFGDMLVGMLGTVPFTPNSQEFDDYYKQVTPSSNTRDPFFEDYCVDFVSAIGGTCTNGTAIPDVDGYSQATFAPFVVEAVYSIAYGIDSFLTENCDQPVEWVHFNQSCKGQKRPLNGSVLLEYISNVNFTSPSGSIVEFDMFGNPTVSMYRVLNYQKRPSGDNQLETIGSWINGEVIYNNLFDVQFSLAESGDVVTSWESRCVVCTSGEVMVPVPLSCCHLCSACLENTYSNSSTSTECLECNEYMWGNNPLNGSDGCVPLEESYLRYSGAGGIVLLVLTAFGLAFVVAVSVFVGLFWTNPVIKSFGREQLVLIMCGITSAFLLPISFVFRPSIVTCILRQLGLWFSMTLVLAALLVKLIRVTRIFLGSVKGGRQCFVKPWQQVLFTILIVVGQMILVVISLVVTNQGANFEIRTEVDSIFPVLDISCTPPHFALLGLLILYDTVLVILINGFAIFTIKFPKNFNEARHIAFATFGIGMVWLTFIPAYFATSSNSLFQAGTVALGVTLMAYCILLCLICPRLYVSFRKKDSTCETTSFSKEATLPFSVNGTLKNGTQDKSNSTMSESVI